MNQHAVAFSKATNMLVDGSEDAYHAAMRLRLREQTMAAVYAYEDNKAWNPDQPFKPLLTEDQLQARIKVLEGLRAYADSLVELTSGKSSPDAQAAASAAGAGLLSLNQSISTKFPNVPTMSADSSNGASAAVLGLANFLASRKVKGGLPKATQEMNPNIMTLCKLLQDDITVLQRQAKVDYGELEVQQDSFIRHAGEKLDPVQRREQVSQLIDLANERQENDELLQKLKDALASFVLTHQALAAAAQNNNPESLSQKIAELAAEGQELGAYYKSLSAS